MNGDAAYWGRKTLLVVTGASQGIGRTLAIAVATSRVDPASTVVLIARSLPGLNATRDLILQAVPSIDVQVVPYDLSKPDAKDFDAMFSELLDEDFKLGLLVHNAGSEGDGAMAEDMSDLEYWQSYMALNLYSMTMLTSSFLKLARVGSKSIVNITSLAAVQPFKSLGYYSVGKAAREAYLRTLAEENPHLDILNYSPGPVKTEMIDRMIGSLQAKDVKEQFKSMRDQNGLVKPQDTCDKLIAIMEAHAYRSGGRIDYFDS